MTDHRRTCVVLQPGYLPWAGFFEQMHRADVFVYLDDVQFDKHGWRNRNRIKGPNGPQWVTVPVRAHGLGKPLINEVAIDHTRANWGRKQLNALRAAYSPCAHFDWLFPELADVITRPWDLLVDLDLAATELLCRKLGLNRPIRRTAQMNVSGDRCGRLVDICRQLDCNTYYSGAAAADYLDHDLFASAGIAVEFQDYAPPTYPQRFPPFASHLSVVDLMFNCGPKSLEILTSGANAAEDSGPTLSRMHVCCADDKSGS